MIDAHSQAVLQDILRRESRSVLRYVAEAFPWSSATEQKALADVQQIVSAEREAVVRLGQFLVHHRIPLPYIASYPASFTTINFLALDYIVPLLIDAERESIAALERDQSSLTDQAARAQVEKLLAVKNRHLSQLEALTPAPAAASLT